MMNDVTHDATLYSSYWQCEVSVCTTDGTVSGLVVQTCGNIWLWWKVLSTLPQCPAHITLYNPVYCANTLVNFTYRNRTHILWEIAIAVISPNITNNTISTILQLTLPFK